MSMWREVVFGEYKFVWRFQCGGVQGKMHFRLASPSARTVLRNGDQAGFERAVEKCMQHAKLWGRVGVYENTVPGTWV